MGFLKDKRARTPDIPRTIDGLTKVANKVDNTMRSISKETANQTRIAAQSVAGKGADHLGKAIHGAGDVLFGGLSEFGRLLRWVFGIIGRVLSFTLGKIALALLLGFILTGAYAGHGYAKEHDIEDPKSFFKHVGKKIEVEKISSVGLWFQSFIQSRIRGIDPTPEPEDTTKYGIFLTGIHSPIEKYHPGTDVSFFTVVKADILADVSQDSPATIICNLEDAEEPTSVFPGEEVQLSKLPRRQIYCNYPPMDISDENQRDASITVVYPFKGIASLPVTVMDPALYDELFDSQMMETRDPVEAYEAIAEWAGCDIDQKAIAKNTPFRMNAYLDGYQPVKKGEKAVMSIVLTNRGEGTAYPETLTATTHDGIKLDTVAQVFPVQGSGNVYDITIPQVPVEREDILSVHVYVLTDSFDTGSEFRQTRIEFELNYRYNVTSEDEISFFSCDDVQYEDYGPCLDGEGLVNESEPTETEGVLGCCLTNSGGDRICVPKERKNCDVGNHGTERITWTDTKCSDLEICDPGGCCVTNTRVSQGCRPSDKENCDEMAGEGMVVKWHNKKCEEIDGCT